GARAEIRIGGDDYLLAEVEVQLEGRPERERYFLPLATTYDEQALTHGWPLLSFSLAQVRRGARVGALYDAMAGRDFPLAALDPMREGRELASTDGLVRAWATSAMAGVELPADVEVKRVSGEQSNSSVIVGDLVMLKAYRKLAAGVEPEIEIGQFLVEKAGFDHTAPLLGAIERVGADGESTALAAAFGFVRNQGDGWVYTTEYLHRTIDELRLAAAAGPPETARPEHEPHAFYLTLLSVLGRRTAELHRAFAMPSDDPAFAPEPITKGDLTQWRRAARNQAKAAFAALEQALPTFADADRARAEALLAQRELCAQRIDELTD